MDLAKCPPTLNGGHGRRETEVVTKKMAYSTIYSDFSIYGKHKRDGDSWLSSSISSSGLWKQEKLKIRRSAIHKRRTNKIDSEVTIKL